MKYINIFFIVIFIEFVNFYRDKWLMIDKNLFYDY